MCSIFFVYLLTVLRTFKIIYFLIPPVRCIYNNQTYLICLFLGVISAKTLNYYSHLALGSSLIKVWYVIKLYLSCNFITVRYLGITLSLQMHIVHILQELGTGMHQLLQCEPPWLNGEYHWLQGESPLPVSASTTPGWASTNPGGSDTTSMWAPQLPGEPPIYPG